MSTAREGLTPAAPGRAEAGTAAVPCEAVLPAPRRCPAGAGPATMPAAAASRARGWRRSREPVRLADPTWRAAARRPPRSPVPRGDAGRVPRSGAAAVMPACFSSPADCQLCAQPPRAGRRTVPARTGRSPAPAGECQMMTRAAKSALAAADYVTDAPGSRTLLRPATETAQDCSTATFQGPAPLNDPGPTCVPAPDSPESPCTRPTSRPSENPSLNPATSGCPGWGSRSSPVPCPATSFAAKGDLHPCSTGDRGGIPAPQQSGRPCRRSCE
jgi:hypothetical protein